MRVAKLIGGLFCALITAAGVYNTAQELSMSNFLLTAAFAVLTWMLLIRKSKKKRKSQSWPATGSVSAEPGHKRVVASAKSAPAPVSAPAKPVPAPAPAARPAPAVRASTLVLRYEGKIAGTSRDGRQGVLARLMKKENDGEVLDFFLEESTYQGKPSIKVMAEVFGEDAPPKQIGFIAAKDVGKVLPLIDTADVDVELYGGPDAGYDFEEGRDFLYGAAISLYTKA